MTMTATQEVKRMGNKVGGAAMEWRPVGERMIKQTGRRDHSVIYGNKLVHLGQKRKRGKLDKTTRYPGTI